MKRSFAILRPATGRELAIVRGDGPPACADRCAHECTVTDVAYGDALDDHVTEVAWCRGCRHFLLVTAFKTSREDEITVFTPAQEARYRRLRERMRGGITA